MYTNVDSMLNKRNGIEALIQLHKPVAFEMKPKNCRYVIDECEIQVNQYDVYHNLQDGGR